VNDLVIELDSVHWVDVAGSKVPKVDPISGIENNEDARPEQKRINSIFRITKHKFL
jgi:hypothetical protein